MTEAKNKTEEEVNRWHDDTEKVYQAKVTGRHAVTLPAELCRELGIATGDTVQFTMRFGNVRMHRAGEEPAPEAYGILAGYFDSIEDVNRFIREEREGWDERETTWSQDLSPRSEPADTSSN